MSCSSENLKPDWKAYVLGELQANDRQQAEAHASACAACRDEVATLRLTLDTLSTLREEEVPRRIAFVSDKVFAPRWWQSFLKPSFAAGCVVAAAIVVHAYARPAVSDAAVQAAVTTAVAQIEKRNTQQIQELLVEYERIAKQNSMNYVSYNGMRRQ